MFNFIKDYFTTQRTKHVLSSNEHLKKRMRSTNEEYRVLNRNIAEYKSVILRFQHFLDKVEVNAESPKELKMLKAFSDYSKSYATNHGEGILALANNAVKRYDFDPGELPNFGWRGLVAEVRDGKIEFVPEQIDMIDWRQYPLDSHIFIEWISHHQRIIDRDNGLTRGDERLIDYCVDFN